MTTTAPDIRSQTTDLAAGPTDDVRRRLAGLACAACGSVTAPLRPGGHAYTWDSEDGRLGWPVHVCPDCPAQVTQ